MLIADQMPPVAIGLVALPPDDARVLLGRLLRFTLLWGLVTYGALFVPPLAVVHYFSQRRSIARQEADGAIVTGSLGIDEITEPPGENPPSPTFRVLEWLSAGCSVLFGIGVVMCLVMREFQAAGGNVLAAVFFAWIAQGGFRARS